MVYFWYIHVYSWYISMFWCSEYSVDVIEHGSIPCIRSWHLRDWLHIFQPKRRCLAFQYDCLYLAMELPRSKISDLWLVAWFAKSHQLSSSLTKVRPQVQPALWCSMSCISSTCLSRCSWETLKTWFQVSTCLSTESSANLSFLNVDSSNCLERSFSWRPQTQWASDEGWCFASPWATFTYDKTTAQWCVKTLLKFGQVTSGCFSVLCDFECDPVMGFETPPAQRQPASPAQPADTPAGATPR